MAMRNWAQVDEDLVLKVKNMVVQALTASNALEMALEVTRQAGQWADGLIEAFEAPTPPKPVACVPGAATVATTRWR